MAIAQGKANKCAQLPWSCAAACSCTAAKDNSYCSVECEAVKHMPDIDCRCTHAGCKGRAH